MNLRSKLQNPFLLVGQGFLAGAVLFFAVSHGASEARSAPMTRMTLHSGGALTR